MIHLEQRLCQLLSVTLRGNLELGEKWQGWVELLNAELLFCLDNSHFITNFIEYEVSILNLFSCEKIN